MGIPGGKQMGGVPATVTSIDGRLCVIAPGITESKS
jgi:hypothetical protein